MLVSGLCRLAEQCGRGHRRAGSRYGSAGGPARGMKQTTLVSASSWAIAAVVAWSASNWSPRFQLVSTQQQSRHCARGDHAQLLPGNRAAGRQATAAVAWNFIVVSLWAIVALPAAENLLLRCGISISGRSSRLVPVDSDSAGPINFVPTRFWLPSLLVAAGQAAALAGGCRCCNVAAAHTMSLVWFWLPWRSPSGGCFAIGTRHSRMLSIGCGSTFVIRLASCGRCGARVNQPRPGRRAGTSNLAGPALCGAVAASD